MTAKEFDPVAFFHVVVCREWEKAYERPISVALPDEPEKVALRALAAEAAKQQARRDAEICRGETVDADLSGESEDFAYNEATEDCAQAIEKEAGLSQDVPTVREG